MLLYGIFKDCPTCGRWGGRGGGSSLLASAGECVYGAVLGPGGKENNLFFSIWRMYSKQMPLQCVNP